MNPTLQILGLIAIGIVIGWITMGMVVYNITMRFKDKNDGNR